MNNKKIFITCLILIALFIGIIVLNKMYRQANAKEIWLICDNMNEYNGYSEKLKFRYKDEDLYGYYREEKFEPKDDIMRQNTIDYYNTTVKTLDLDDDFDYTLKEKKENLQINTYIGVKKRAALFDKYISSFKITYKTKIEDVKSLIEQKNYECEVKYN